MCIWQLEAARVYQGLRKTNLVTSQTRSFSSVSQLLIAVHTLLRSSNVSLAVSALSLAIYTALLLAILDIWSFHSTRLPRIRSFMGGLSHSCLMCSFRTLSFDLLLVILLNFVISAVSKAFFEQAMSDLASAA
jgi:phosphotransferase system  glucose/maltose/N-acetylglucosamine-specific IIC component